MSFEGLLTTRQAADRRNLDVSTISKMVKDGRLTPKFRHDGNGAMFFDPADVDAAEVTPRPKAAAQ
jgi:hypothetical protein